MLNDLGLSLGVAVDPAVSLGVAAAYLVLLAALLLRARAHYRSIPELISVEPSSTPPDCMVIIPARNEEGSVGRAVKSFPHDSVIVVDDASTDGTAKEAREAGAGVLEVRQRPRGALGKPLACGAGAKALQTRWILFADADTWYEPQFLHSAVAAAETSSLDFVSFHLPFEPEGFAEHMLVPYAAALFFSGVHPRSDAAAAFNGQCVLVRREAYEFVGGHGSLLNDIADDVRLALLARRHRMKLALARAQGLGHARLHRGWSGLSEGFRRNARRFMAISTWCGIRLWATALLAALWLPMVLFLLLVDQPVAAAIVGVAPLVMLQTWYRSWLRVLLAPFAVYLILPVLALSTLFALTGSRASWKDRDV